MQKSRKENGPLLRAPIIPPLNIRARATVNATVASMRCSTSVLEKCQIDPLWIGMLWVA
ncbi:uncharacterized protein METZ01_LOCUS56383 [marine metagenome]|uniref:Uncharacterized protein n=1 Tax=marine metagenome TaxID=408172 RepID=A0A381SJD0_9ZZZZ